MRTLLLAGLVVAAPALALENAADRPQLDVVFVLDTTGSMGGLIEGAKEKVWSIASRMASGQPTPRVRVGLVAYRDRGDAYTTKRFDLTDNLDAVYKNLRALTADGGGDTPEHVGRGLGEAVKLMSWGRGQRTAKLIFVVGDAPGHDDYQDEFNLAAMAKLAIGKGIVVNTIRCGNDAQTEAQFRAVSKLADGSFSTIGQTGDMKAVVTPFDADLARLNAAIAGHSQYGGSPEGRATGNARSRELESMSAATAADRLSFRAKERTAPKVPAEVVSAGGIDLVLEPWRVESLDDDQLPATVQALPKAARRQWLELQRAERYDLEAEVHGVAARRDAWLNERAEAQQGSFDATVMEKVRETAGKVGVTYFIQ